VLLSAAAGIGRAWDSLLMTLDFFDHASGVVPPNTAAPWIVAMWMLYATMLNSAWAGCRPQEAECIARRAVWRALGDVHMRLTKPLCRRPALATPVDSALPSPDWPLTLIKVDAFNASQ
jgi:hypothetical protein